MPLNAFPPCILQVVRPFMALFLHCFCDLLDLAVHWGIISLQRVDFHAWGYCVLGSTPRLAFLWSGRWRGVYLRQP